MVSESELINMASKRPKNTSAKARPCRARSAWGVEAPAGFANTSADGEAAAGEGAAAAGDGEAAAGDAGAQVEIAVAFALEAVSPALTAIGRLFPIRVSSPF